MQTHLVQLVHFLEPCSLGARAGGSPAHDGVRGRRGAPDQVIIEATARVCRAAGLELGDGTKPGADSIAGGFGLGEVLIVFAVEALLVGTSPHRAARFLLPAGIRKLVVGAAPHLATGSVGAQSALNTR